MKTAIALLEMGEPKPASDLMDTLLPSPHADLFDDATLAQPGVPILELSEPLEPAAFAQVLGELPGGEDFLSMPLPEPTLPQAERPGPARMMPMGRINWAQLQGLEPYPDSPLHE